MATRSERQMPDEPQPERDDVMGRERLEGSEGAEGMEGQDTEFEDAEEDLDDEEDEGTL